MSEARLGNKQSIIYIAIGAVGLFLVYFFQEYLDFHSVLFRFAPPQRLDYSASYVDVDVFPFVFNKAGRYVLNDLFSISLIYGIFREKKYARFAFVVMMFGMVVLLPAYLYIYLAQPAGFTSMLSHLHRVVMNPVLMMLLIPAFFAQRRSGRLANDN